MAINDPSITRAHCQIGLYPTFTSAAFAREAVRTERRLELAMEGQRLFDLRRWGTPLPRSMRTSMESVAETRRAGEVTS